VGLLRRSSFGESVIETTSGFSRRLWTVSGLEDGACDSTQVMTHGVEMREKTALIARLTPVHLSCAISSRSMGSGRFSQRSIFFVQVTQRFYTHSMGPVLHLSSSMDPLPLIGQCSRFLSGFDVWSFEKRGNHSLAISTLTFGSVSCPPRRGLLVLVVCCPLF